MYGGKQHRRGRHDLRLRQRERGRARADRSRHRHLGHGDSERAPGILRQTPRVSITVRRVALARRRLGRSELEALLRLGRRSARDRAQLQVLSPGHEQDRRHLGRGGGLSPRLLLADGRAMIDACPLPAEALLNRYRSGGGFADCYVTEIPSRRQPCRVRRGVLHDPAVQARAPPAAPVPFAPVHRPAGRRAGAGRARHLRGLVGGEAAPPTSCCWPTSAAAPGPG